MPTHASKPEGVAAMANATLDRSQHGTADTQVEVLGSYRLRGERDHHSS